jgi:hypothetical protein
MFALPPAITFHSPDLLNSRFHHEYPFIMTILVSVGGIPSGPLYRHKALFRENLVKLRRSYRINCESTFGSKPILSPRTAGL